MAVPVKFREIGDFHLYYSGAEVAPYLTIFVGGNHEASNHLWELYYGGWVAPNIYYMGAANVLRLGTLRIAGLSGIWKGYNYRKPHFERLPYSQDDVRSIYHVREYDARKLLQLSTQVDIGISHDWPQGIEWLGNYRWLFKKKDLFEADARTGKLGSVAAKLVLERLRPPYWFSAHLHIKYAAVVDHTAPWPDRGPIQPQRAPERSSRVRKTGETHNAAEIDLGLDNGHDKPTIQPDHTITATPHNNDEIELDLTDEPNAVPAHNADEIDLDVDDDPTDNVIPTHTTSDKLVPDDLRAQLPASFSRPPEPAQQPDPPHSITNTITQFLALDKCLPRRDFLQLLEIPGPTINTTTDNAFGPLDPLRLTYDPEWLAITRVFANDLPITSSTTPTARDLGRAHYAPLIERERRWVDEHIVSQNKLIVPYNFSVTAPIHDFSADALPMPKMPREYSNSQTEAFCEMLAIPNPFKASEEEILARMAVAPPEEQRRGGGSGRGRGRGHGRGRGGLFGSGGRGRGRGRGSW